MSLPGKAMVAKHKDTAFSLLFTKACFLGASEPSDKEEKLQKSLSTVTKKQQPQE
jgi:hypothetical protein